MGTANYGRRMVWRGLEAASHVSLLGSIHFFDGPLPGWVLQVCDTADKVVFEADTSKARPLPSLPRGKSLKSLSLEVGRRACAIAERLGGDPADVNRLYPWAAAIQIGIWAQPEEMQLEHGTDHVLRQQTGAEGKGSLESFEEQYRLLFKEVPLQEQISGLADSLDRLDSAPETLRQLLEAWRRGDIEAIWSISKYSELEVACPNIVAGTLTKRHELWLPRAVELIEQSAAEGERLLLVPGCLHLTGPYSFLTYLKSAGYNFQQD